MDNQNIQNNTLLTIIVIFMAAFLCRCADPLAWAISNSEEYVPKDKQIILSNMNIMFGQRAKYLEEIVFFKADFDTVQEICNVSSKKYPRGVAACIFVERRVIFAVEEYSENCRVLSHEYGHDLSQRIYGDTNGSHDRTFFWNFVEFNGCSNNFSAPGYYEDVIDLAEL